MSCERTDLRLWLTARRDSRAGMIPASANSIQEYRLRQQHNSHACLFAIEHRRDSVYYWLMSYPETLPA